jgi:hypothetical protein
MQRAAPKPEPKPMDIPEMAAKQEIATEPQRAADQEEQQEKEYEEGIMLRASDLLHFQDTLMDIRSQIADLQRDARQDRLEIQGMFQAILNILPPASGPSAPPPAP